VLHDSAGREHEFHFRYVPAPRGIKAFEVIGGHRGSYQFQILQQDDDPSIVGELLERMRRTRARRHLRPCPITLGGLGIDDRTVCVHIAWDEEQDGLIPSLLIDGQPVSWRQLGFMLTAFEGWQFRLEILDKSEEP